MKNIHILPTDKPSRLVKIYNDVNRETFTLKLDVEVNDSFKEYVNIYIISDEEIKDGDWFIHSSHGTTTLLKCKSTNSKEIIDNEDKSCWLEYSHKIILTTDQELIKDGVQAIDNEFLEWFVKNPSCERVRVDKFVSGKYFCTNPIISKEETKPKTMLESLQEYLKNTPKEKVLEDWNEFQHLDNEGITVNEFLENQKQTDEKGRPLTYWGGLEENRQETFVNGKCFKCGRNQYSSRKPFCTDDFCNKDFYQKPKQETLEEAAKDFIENTMKLSFISNDTKTQANRMFKCVEFGAKWQQEQSKNLYSEEEVHEIILSYQNNVENTPNHITYNEWFEQFKNK